MLVMLATLQLLLPQKQQRQQQQEQLFKARFLTSRVPAILQQQWQQHCRLQHLYN
jgi:hypothetical protein